MKATNIPLTWRGREAVVGNLQINENDIGNTLLDYIKEHGRLEMTFTIAVYKKDGITIDSDILSANLDVMRE
jgi:hypothetical protein